MVHRRDNHGIDNCRLLVVWEGTYVPWLQSDEKQVETIIINGGELLNEKDYQALYETMNTNYLLNASYRRFQDYVQENITAVLVLVGPGKWEVTDLRVRIEGDWAFANYKMRKAGEVIISVPDDTETEDIYRKLDGKWYDVAEDPSDPGYNFEDLPPQR